MFEKLKQLMEPIDSVGPEEAKRKMLELEEGSYTLLDVRQPKEYEESHIPGATLIPMPDLSDSIDRLDKDKPVFVY